VEFRLALEDFDRSLLPVDGGLLDADPGLLGRSVQAWFADRLARLGGDSRVVVDDRSGEVVVQWVPAGRGGPRGLANYAASLVEAGRADEAVPFLRLAVSADPDDAAALRDLGALLGERGRLDEGIGLLRRATGLAPGSARAWALLGAALGRKGDAEGAEEAFGKAMAADPGDGHALKGLAALRAGRGDLAKARELYESARAALPADAEALIGLAEVLLALGEPKDADAALTEAVAIDPTGGAGERARRLRSRLAEASFRRPAGVRKDAVMHCLSAIRKFEGMEKEAVRRIAYEIAMLGRGGLDVNNPDRTYRLRAMPGEFTGLQLVSYMYVGFQVVEPGVDIGFDLSREYQAAKALHEKG